MLDTSKTLSNVNPDHSIFINIMFAAKEARTTCYIEIHTKALNILFNLLASLLLSSFRLRMIVVIVTSLLSTFCGFKNLLNTRLCGNGYIIIPIL